MSTGEFANIGYTINVTNVTFQATSSLDRFGAVHYVWTFGDTTSFTGQTVSHTYAVSGAYNVHLSAVIGSTHTSSDALVQVPASPPTIASITDDVGLLTGALSDGQSTDDNDLAVKVSLPTGSGVTAASIGDVLRLDNPWQTLTSYTLTASDIANGHATVQTGFLFDGVYDLTAQIIGDGGTGATSQLSDVFQVTVDATAPGAPALGFGPGVSDTNGATASEAQIPGAVTVRGTEPGTTIAVTFTNGANSVTKTVPGLGYDQAVALTAADIATLTDGTILVSAIQSDGLGNASPASTTSFALDTQAPAAPVVALGTGVAFGGATAAEAQQPGGLVTVSAEAGTTITVEFSGVNSLQKTLIASGSPQAVVLDAGDISYLGDGNITVGAFATDSAGNSSPPGIAFLTLDTLPPVPGSLIVADPLIDNNEVHSVPFLVFGVEPGGSAVATFTDGTPANIRTVNILAGTTSYVVDLSGFGRNVTSSLTVHDAAGNSTTSAGIPTIVATSPDLVLKVAEFESLSPVEWQGNPAYTSVTLLDGSTILQNLTLPQIAALGPAGVESLQARSGAFALTVAQYQALGTVLLPASQVVTLADTNANLTGLDFGTLQAGGIDKINATGDSTLTVDLGQYGALGAGLTLTNASVVTLADSGAVLGALSPGDLAALAGKGIDFIHATNAGNTLTFDVAQILALGSVQLTATDTVTVADDAAALSALTSAQIKSLATKGVDFLEATSGDLILTRSQGLNLGGIKLLAAGEVVLADSGGQLAQLTGPQFADLAAAGVERIDAAGDALKLSLAHYQALGTVTLTGSDVVTLAGTNADLSGLDFDALKSSGIDRIDATGDNALTIDMVQFGALGAGLALTGADAVTLADSAEALSVLLPAQIAALAGMGIDRVDVASGNLSLGLSDFNALGTTVITGASAITVNGAPGAADDKFVFSRQTFTDNDSVVGGDGKDTLRLIGDYSVGTLAFGPDSLSSTEKVVLGAGYSYHLTEAGNLSPGQSLTISAAALGALDSIVFNGSAESAGNFTLQGGAGTNDFTGGQGKDLVFAGTGADTIRYTAATQSTGTGFDTVAGFDAHLDHFDTGSAVANVVAVTAGDLSVLGFDASLAAATAGHLTVGGAVLFTPAAGDLANSAFLVVDLNRSGAYESGSGGDLVVQLTKASNMESFGSSNFINPPADGGTWT